MKRLLLPLFLTFGVVSCANFEQLYGTYCSERSCAEGCCDGYACQANVCVPIDAATQSDGGSQNPNGDGGGQNPNGGTGDGGDDGGATGMEDAGTPVVLETTITSGPTGSTGPNPQFAFTSNIGVSFECQLAPVDTAFSACTSPKPYTTLAAMSGYTFSVRAIDSLGTPDATPATRAFSVSPGPTINITAPAANATVGTSFVGSFTTETNVTYTCQIDSNAAAPCASGTTFPGLSAGAHTFKVTGTDSVTSLTASQQISITVDATGPDVVINGSPAHAATVNSTSASFTFSPNPSGADSPYTYECKFNMAANFGSCTTSAGFAVSNLIQGMQTLQVRAKDKFGNYGNTATRSWSITVFSTTINSIRTGIPNSIPLGTRVQIGPGAGTTLLKMTSKAFDRFWVQDIDGNAAGTGADYHGITVQPTGSSTTDLNLAPGRVLTIIGTVGTLNGSNLTLLNATYTVGTLSSTYNAKNSDRDSLNVLTEKYEGMLVSTAGRASNSAAVECEDYDFCIATCDRSTGPFVLSIDASATPIQINQDHNFEGIVEGRSTGTYPYTYWVLDAQEGSDACL